MEYKRVTFEPVAASCACTVEYSNDQPFHFEPTENVSSGDTSFNDTSSNKQEIISESSSVSYDSIL